MLVNPAFRFANDNTEVFARAAKTGESGWNFTAVGDKGPPICNFFTHRLNMEDNSI